MARGCRRFNNATEAKICAAYQSGTPIYQIKHAFKAPEQTIRCILIRREIISGDAAIRKTDWTPGQTEKLKQLWAEGKSAAQIAKALGRGSRLSIIGKANRLRLPARISGQPYHLRKIAA